MISRILQWLLMLSVAGFLVAGLWFRSGLLQEPLRTALTALRLEFSTEKKIFANESEFVIRARDITIALEMFREEGWDQVERLGSEILLKQREKRAGFACRMYSSRYMVCRRFEPQAAPSEPTNASDDGRKPNAAVLPFGTYDLPDKNSDQPEALVKGKLIVEAGCLYLANDDQRYLPLFPARFTSYSPSERALIILGHSIPLGTQIETNGGYFQTSELPKMRVIDPVPEDCNADEAVLVGTQAWN